MQESFHFYSFLTGVAAALRSEVEELRKVEAEVEQLRKRRDEGKVCRIVGGRSRPLYDKHVHMSQVEEAKRRKRSHSVGQRESIGVHTRSQSLQVNVDCSLLLSLLVVLAICLLARVLSILMRDLEGPRRRSEWWKSRWA